MRYQQIIAFFLFMSMYVLRCYDEILRFRPPWMWHEPYFHKPGLTEFSFLGAHGSASSAFSCTGKEIPLADIWGIQSIHKAALSADTTFHTPFSHLLTELSHVAGSVSFAHISLDGNLDLKEFAVIWSQNFSHGLFMTGYIPARSIQIGYLAAQDLTPLEEQDNVIWKKIKSAGEIFYQACRCSTENYSEGGLGDSAFSLGWTLNYENTKKLDFIDASFQLGVVLPTSPVVYPEHMLTFEIGYGGHAGCFMSVDSSFGMYDWLTCGMHAQYLIFDTQKQLHRVKTDDAQSSLFLLTTQYVMAHRDPALSAGLYLKADHVILGLSCALAYGYVHQGGSQWLLLPSQERYSFADQRLLSWETHILHVSIDYDFATFNHPNVPKMGFSYDVSVAGKNSIPTKLTGALWDILICWTF